MLHALTVLFLVQVPALPARPDSQNTLAFEAGAITAFSDAAIQLGLRDRRFMSGGETAPASSITAGIVLIY